MVSFNPQIGPTEQQYGSQEERTDAFSIIPSELIQRALGYLSDNALQAVRQVAKFMNAEVITRVNDSDAVTSLIEFFIIKLPLLKEKLQAPQSYIDALNSSNLNIYRLGVYATRSRLVHVLKTLPSQEIDELEEAWNAKQTKLPKKFEKIFDIVRIHQIRDGNERLTLGEQTDIYEHFRIISTLSTDERDRLLIYYISIEESWSWDCYSAYSFIERLYLRDDEVSPRRNEVLFRLYERLGCTRIEKGLYDKGIEAISNAVKHLVGLPINDAPFGNDDEDELGLCSQEQDPFEDLVLTLWNHVDESQIDSESALKLFEPILEYSISHRSQKTWVLYSRVLCTCAWKNFDGLQQVMNSWLEWGENCPDISTKHESFRKNIKFMKTFIQEMSVLTLRGLTAIAEGQRELIKSRLFHALQEATDCDSKYALLSFCFSQGLLPASVKIDDNNNALAMMNNIECPELKSKMMNQEKKESSNEESDEDSFPA